MKTPRASTQMNAQIGSIHKENFKFIVDADFEVIGTYFSFYCTYVDLVLSVSDVEIFVDAPLVDI